MEYKTRGITDMRRNFLRRTVIIIAVVLSLGVAVIVSDDVDEEETKTSPIFDYNDIPDMPYFSLNNTLLLDLYNLSDEITNVDSQSTISLDYPESQSRDTPSWYNPPDDDDLPKSNTRNVEKNTETSLSNTAASSQQWTSEPPQVTTIPTQTSSTASSSIASTALTTFVEKPHTTTSAINVTSSTVEKISTDYPYTTKSSMTESTKLSNTETTTLISTSTLSSTIPTTTPAIRPPFCNITRSSIYESKCNYPCKPGDVPVKDSKKICARLFTSYYSMRCLRVYQEPACCQGYWGANCEDCPGGYQNPCNGHGMCQNKTGKCECQPGFTGTACELCKETGKYGPDCSQDCSCEHGACNDGARGDGSCDCESGYKGKSCDTEILECETLHCRSGSDEKWRCAEVNGTATCLCNREYEPTPDLTDCTARNPCNNPVYPCGNNSRCEHTGPGKHTCVCQEDYYGDGIVCLPIDPCDIFIDTCEKASMCKYIGPNKSKCECIRGYENYIPGTGCSIIDVCTARSCDPNAICETKRPFLFSCTCKDEYIGDGSFCYGNILQRLNDINSKSPKFTTYLTFAINILSKFYAEPISKHGPFTIFVPTDKAFRDINKDSGGFRNFLGDEDRAMQIIRQHILIGRFRLEDLQSFETFYTLQGNPALLQIRVSKDVFRFKLQRGTDRAKILDKNYVASNGMIHIVNSLMTLEPDIAGDKMKTAMDLIKLEGTYNRFQTLIMSAGLADVFTQPNITVFAPENAAWDGLPPGTLDYLMKDEDGQEKLKVILKNHIYPDVIGITHLINRKFIKSLANVEVKVSISTLGQVQLNGKVSVSQANIPCSTGFYHHVNGIIIPSYIEQIMPNRCVDTLSKEIKGDCQICSAGRLTCPQTTDTLTNKTVQCQYYRLLRIPTKWNFQGCSPICNRTVKVPKCCPGFYGSDCMPCPGGFRNPCNGRGKCSDSMTGAGLCFCDDDFIGTACDRCRQKDVFGPSCNQTCTCLYGQCDDGPKGTGICKPDSCQLGYEGDNCDLKLVPCYGKSLICHAHAKCFLDNNTVSRCQCEMGYEGEGDDCDEINPCERDDRGGCHQQATCTKVGPGVNHCECNYGWFGDGFFCSPKTPCQDHTDCDVNAKCFNSEPGQYHCVCKVGYKGDGKACVVVNLCVENNGGCHSKAICTPLKAGERNCTCPENLQGDGFTCYGTIADEVMSHPNLTRLADLLKKVSKSDNILNNRRDTMTLFAPSDVAMDAFMESFVTWNQTSYWQDEENIVWFMNFHTLYSAFSIQDLFAREGIMKYFNTLYDGFSLYIFEVKGELLIMVNHSDFTTISNQEMPAINGYIHIIDKVLVPFLPEDDLSFLSDQLASNPQYKLFYKAMQITGELDQINDMDAFTVFVPTNDAIKRLNSTVNPKFIKFYIVPKLVFTASIVDHDMFETLLGPEYKLMMITTQNSFTVNGVKVTRPDILFGGGVMHEIDGVLHPIYNRCDFNTTEVKIADCGDCTNASLGCPQGYFPFSPPRVIKYECTFKRYENVGWPTIGCQHICGKNISKLECCGGYFGIQCTECPGGAETPCSGNGRCNAGLAGNGTCFCDKGFSGPDCGRCESPDLVPPSCNFTYNSCGYRHGNCSEHAVCNDSSGDVVCGCPPGYVGDGYTCRSQCEMIDNGGCHSQADCVVNVSKNEVQCTCKEGFHGNGTWCLQIIDPCASDNGGCHLERAVCNFMSPKVTDMFQGNSSCECKEGYAGDGKLCIGDFMDAISILPELKYLSSRLQNDELLFNKNVTHLLTDHEARCTVFLPISTNWQTLDITGLVAEGGIFTLPKNYDGPYNAEDSSTDEQFIGQLEALNGQTINVTVNAKKLVFANDVLVIQANIDTINGILHLTEVPIVRYEQAQVGASRDKGGSNSSVVIICVVVLVVVVLVATLVGAIIYTKKHHEGFFKIFQRAQSNSESNISFARLNAQEEEEDAFKAKDNARYDNPIFNDPDLLN